MPLNGNPHPLPGQLMPNLNNFVNPQFPEIGWDEQEQVQPHDNVQGMQHPPFVLEQVQDQIMEVEDELEVEEEQEEMVQPVVQESHQFNDSALINSSSSEGSVNTGAVPQQLVINRIEVQFEVLGKDLTSFWIGFFLLIQILCKVVLLVLSYLKTWSWIKSTRA
jgi:hypothetical protein